MRYLFGFMCVLALGVMGCGETTGDGGSGGSAGSGGMGGDGGDGGSAGIGGVGGSAGEGGQGGNGGVVADCTGVEYFTECMSGDGEGVCLGGECAVVHCSSVGDETVCLALVGFDDLVPGLCSEGDCLRECAVMEEGAACHIPWTGFGPIEIGVCEGGECVAPP